MNRAQETSKTIPAKCKNAGKPQLAQILTLFFPPSLYPPPTVKLILLELLDNTIIKQRLSILELSCFMKLLCFMKLFKYCNKSTGDLESCKKETCLPQL